MSQHPTPQNVIASFEEEHGHTHWVSRAAFSLIGAGMVVSQIAIGIAVYHHWFWLAVPMVLLASHFMHGALIGFHEASHGMLRKNRFLNDLDGIIAGVLSFMSFTLYRAAHQKHHSHLATERDVELWPFVIVDSPRWLRRLVAFIELNAGLLFTPYLFAKVFLQKDSPIRSRKVRRRIWAEFALIIGFWTLVLSAVAYWQVWTYFLWIFLAPGIIAGNLQSWRKYIEHVGLSGHTARSATRSIVANTWSGRLLSLTLLHEPFHGVHHLRVGLPHTELPRHAALLEPVVEGEVAPFPNYRTALMDLLRNLSDPRSGSHWPDRKTTTIH
ncbi:MAG: fatty acid desaturase [Verrucomicrobia bacterium]|nr:fatty acid desaturase [Verrucomicrobiota bacterium]